MRVLTVVLAALLSTAAAAATGCAAPQPDEEVASTDEALTSDQRGYDVTVLQAWIGKSVGRRYSNGYQLGDLALDLSRCSGDDCRGAASDVLDSPLIGPFSYSADYSGQCETLEIRTLTRNTALEAPTFRGIGFYLSSLGGTTFVTKEALPAADPGEVTLKDGSKGHVHRFVTKGTCFGLGGNGGSLYRRSYALRPYAQFEADSETTYRIWDQVPTDYVLGRNGTDWTQSFDRQGELLQP